MVRGRLIALLVVLMLFASTSGFTQPSTGTVEGRVLDGVSGDPLPGVAVTLVGSSIATATDLSGAFRLAGAPAGEQTLLLTYLGRQDARTSVTVRPGLIVGVTDVSLQKFGFEESVSVSAEFIKDAQAKALNQQKTAPNITNVVSADQIGSFPDRNAAETTQRIPGVSITKDQGDGRYVLVRGAEPRLNSMMINGERIPSPDPTLRQVALDVVPSELLQSIEVSKALTPDQDGDAIGGSVDLVMKRASEKLRFLGAFGGGYNYLLDSYSQNNYSASGGGRFDDGKMGLVFAVGGSTLNRANQDVEAAYTGDLNLQDLDPRYYQVKRDRVGVTGTYDFAANANTRYAVSGLYNRYIDDHENRQRFRNRVSNRRLERELRDRTHLEHINSLTFTGNHLATWGDLDYRLLGAYSDQTDPLTTTTTFRQANVDFAPNVTPTSIDPNNVQANPLNQNVNAYTFNNQVLATNGSSDRDVVAAANLRRPVGRFDAATFLKFGLKYRDKKKTRFRDESTVTTSSRLPMTDYLESGFDLKPFLDGRYDLTPYLSQSKVEQIRTQAPVTIAPNQSRDAEDFDGTERTTAGYAMAEVYAGSKLFVLPGFRYEYTALDYTGKQVLFSPSGAWLSTTPIHADNNYGIFLPAVHVKYAMTPDTNLRTAVTRSFARPNYFDLVPSEVRNDLDHTATVGNADLKPTTSWNVDVMGEHYFKSVGVVSAGFFYKNLQDYIYTYTYAQLINGNTYQYTQPLNGESASITGVELALQNQLTFLPSPLNGLGVYLNYTYADSSAAFPNHPGDSSLPQQPKHVGNVAFSYEKKGFQGRFAMNFHGSYVDVVGATDILDRYYDSANQIDVSLSQKVSRNFRVYADILNMNDALLRYYQGTSDRVLQEEHYRWWTTFGVKVNF